MSKNNNMFLFVGTYSSVDDAQQDVVPTPPCYDTIVRLAFRDNEHVVAWLQ